MTPARRPVEREPRQRREVLLADLDRFDTTRALHRRTPAQSALSAAVRAAVQSALTPRQRDIVEAYFFEGLSQCEIATRMGVAQQVIHKALFGDLRRGRRVGGALARLKVALTPAVAAARAASHHGH